MIGRTRQWMPGGDRRATGKGWAWQMAERGKGQRRSFRDFITFKINRTGRQLERFSERYYHQLFGLKLAEYRFIGGIGYQTDATLTRVSEAVGLEKGHASRLMAGLVERGLIGKTDSKRDQRSAFLHLTEKGVALYEGMHGAALALNACLTDVLAPEQVQALKTGLVLVHDRLAALNETEDAVAAVKASGTGPSPAIDSTSSIAQPPLTIDVELARNLHAFLGGYIEKHEAGGS